jgi:hypothetical protein
MQTLGLSDSTPRTENRAKALFWPTIRNEGDLDYVTQQGFWICTLVAAFSFVLSAALLSGAMRIFGIGEALFYYLAGNGVRMRSRWAAILAFAAYLLGGIVLQKQTGSGFGVVRIIFLALLLANVRGIWLSASWTRDPAEPPLFRLNETWRDKLVDQLPGWLWPKTKILFFMLAAIEILLLCLSLFPISPTGSYLG